MSYFPFKEGIKMVYNNYDRKGKLTGSQEINIMEVSGTGDDMDAKIKSIVRDKKGKEIMSTEYDMKCEDGGLRSDATASLDPSMLQSMQGMEMTIEGDQLVLPSNLSVGQELPPATINVSAATNGIGIISMDVMVEDRKVVEKTAVTTPVKQYDCFKITQNTTVKMMVKKKISSVEYYAPGVGMVRTETLDKNGKLESYTELASFE